jgi:hypothetical protein
MDVLMNSLRSVLLAASVLGAATCSDSSGLASAASNADSLTMTCAQVQDYINEHGQTLLTTGKESGNYSFDYAECGGTVPGYACTRDEAYCYVGWWCDCRVGCSGQQSCGGHELATAALDDLEIKPRLLNFASCLRFADSIDRGDLSVADRTNRQQTRADRFAIELHRACAALRDATAEFGVGHAENIAQHPKERRVTLDIDHTIDAIDLNGEGRSYLRTFKSECEGQSSWLANPGSGSQASR